MQERTKTIWVIVQMCLLIILLVVAIVLIMVSGREKICNEFKEEGYITRFNHWDKGCEVKVELREGRTSWEIVGPFNKLEIKKYGVLRE